MSYGKCAATQADGTPCDRAARTSRGLCEHHLTAARATCSEPDCPKPSWCRGICQAHYNQRRRAGTLPPKLSPAELAAKAAGADVPAKRDMNSPESHAKAALTRTRSWRAWLKGTLRAEDQDAFRLAEPLAAALISDKGGRDGLTAGEAALVQQVVVARVAATLCLKSLATEGAFTTTPDGERVASAALRELPKFLGAERQALQVLGLDRRPLKALTLSDLFATARELPESTPAEATIANAPEPAA